MRWVCISRHAAAALERKYSISGGGGIMFSMVRGLGLLVVVYIYAVVN